MCNVNFVQNPELYISRCAQRFVQYSSQSSAVCRRQPYLIYLGNRPETQRKLKHALDNHHI